MTVHKWKTNHQDENHFHDQPLPRTPPEASLVVPNFTTFVYDRKCNFRYFGLILAPWLFLSTW